jgi:sulfite exporter TauE/SafE/copper chaperone CopZ
MVAGMTCHHCEQRISKSLLGINGIKKANASFDTGLVNIYYDDKIVNEKQFKDKISEIGYEYKGIADDKNKKIIRTSFKDVLPIFISFIILYLIIGSIAGFNFIYFIPTVSETTPFVMLFLIGLLTSVHCVGMCGSINLAVSVGTDDKASISRPLAYNLGRIISYTTIGAVVGGLGSVLSFNTTFQGILILIASIFMFMMGLAMLGWLPKVLYRFLPKIPSNLKRVFREKNNTPLMAGLLNGFMPCGPLQAMQLYALSTGSILAGAASMFIFALGTVPLVFGFGLLFSSLKGKYNVIIQRISSVLVVLLSIVMLGRAFAYFGIDVGQTFKNLFVQDAYKDYVIADINDEKQYVEIELKPNGYTPIIVQKGIPVVFNIKAQNIQRFGCTNSIKIPKLNINLDLKNGDNLIKFTPTEVGNITYTCWMGMVTSNIKVVDDISKLNDK